MTAWSLWLRRLIGVGLFGYDGFISHAHADGRAYAVALWAALERLGLTICLDRRDFDAGDALVRKLRGTVSASRLLILLDTPQARGSTYVADEIATAIAKARRIVPIRHPDADPHGWPHLSRAHQELVTGLIRLDEPAEGFVQGSVRFETVDAIRRSLSVWSTRQWLNRLALGLAGVALASVAAALVASLASSTVKALQWTLEDRGTPLPDGIDQVEAFLRGPLYVVADLLYHDDTDRLLDRVARAAVKARRLDEPLDTIRASPGGQAVVIDRGPSFEVRTATSRTGGPQRAGDAVACAAALDEPPDAFGVDDTGTVFVAVGASAVSSWNTADCRQPLARVPWAALGGAPSGPAAGVRVVRRGLEPSADVWERRLLIWSERDVVTLDLTADGLAVAGRLHADATAAPGQAQKLFDAAASSGSTVALLAGPFDSFTPDRVCLASWALELTEPCAIDAAVTLVALDQPGRHLIVSTSVGSPGTELEFAL